MLLRRGFLVFLIVIVTLQLCSGDDEKRDDDCNNRGRRRRGEERRRGGGERKRERGQRRQPGERKGRGERKRIPGAGRRSFIGAPPRPSVAPVTIEPPQNVIVNGKEHHNGHHGHKNGVNGNHGHSNGHHYNAINGNGYGSNGKNGNGMYTNGNRINGINGRPSYLCPAGFVRLGNACYLLSQHIATWQEAHFQCRDLGSQLAGLETAWEDETMRKYLNKNELARLERWIGGIYNWEQRRWIWGASGKRMSYQGFSRRSPNEDRQWHCVLMDPTRLYRWTHRSCVEERHFICEAPLQQETTHKDKNEI